MANKTFDTLGLIIEAIDITATDTTPDVEQVGLNLGSASYVCVINTSALVGTFDGSNNYVAQLEVSSTSGGTYFPIGEPVTFENAEQAQIGFTAEQVERAITGAKNFRVSMTKVGTTATGITFTSFLSKI